MENRERTQRLRLHGKIRQSLSKETEEGVRTKVGPEGHGGGHFQGQEVKFLYQALPTVGHLNNIFHFSHVDNAYQYFC